MTQSFLRILLLCLALLTGCKKTVSEEKEYARPVLVYIVPSPMSMASRPFPGRTRAENRVTLSFRVDGPLIEFPVKVGDRVTKGKLLAKIDPRDFEVTLKNAEGTLEKGKAELTFAESDFDRAQRIQQADPGAISQSLVDRKRETRNEAVARNKSLEADVQSAKHALQDSYLLAPFDGTIVATYVDNFEFVRAKQPIVRLLDTSRVEMLIHIPESLINLAPHVGKIEVTLDPFPGKTFEATIKEIGTEPSATTRTYPVTLVMQQPEGATVLAGMAGEARIFAQIPENLETLGVEVPLSALFTETGTSASYVWVVDSSTMQISKRPVELGKMLKEGALVKKGLQPGERIVKAGVHSLKEGEKVNIVKEE